MNISTTEAWSQEYAMIVKYWILLLSRRTYEITYIPIFLIV